jgi:ABC-type nitrate/sulfonate/bicarbonate transport system ATPase subunit
MDQVLKIENLSFSYGDNRLIENYSLTLNKGERICLSAASGKGKTTLLRLISGLETPHGGSITINGTIAYLFQEDRLIPWRTAAENIILAGATRSEALAALEAVGLDGSADKYPRELSGGMKRRVAIARTLCFGGDLLLLDEPFTGIDAERRELVAGAIDSYFAGSAMILISHIADESALLRAETFEAKFSNL